MFALYRTHPFDLPGLEGQVLLTALHSVVGINYGRFVGHKPEYLQRSASLQVRVHSRHLAMILGLAIR